MRRQPNNVAYCPRRCERHGDGERNRKVARNPGGRRILNLKVNHSLRGGQTGLGRGWALLAVVGMLALVAVALLYFLLRGPRPDALLDYKQVGQQSLQLHLFRPRSDAPASGYPALLLFHGGGWETGAPWQFYRQCEVYSRQGVLCLSAQYRTRARFGTPPHEAVSDALDALIYLRSNQARFGIDPRRLYVGGGSSGGHLAALLGSDRVPPVQRPAGLVLFNPLLNLAPGYHRHERAGEGWRDISPAHRLSAPAPDALIMSGTADVEVLVPTLQDYCTRLEQVGGRCQLELFEGAEHGFFNPREGDEAAFESTNELVLEFLGVGGD